MKKQRLSHETEDIGRNSTHPENEKWKLKISLDQGGMFFSETEDLEEDESMKIMTPNKTNMLVSIRGTSGIVQKKKLKSF